MQSDPIRSDPIRSAREQLLEAGSVAPSAA